jgi:hypothetical protein
MEQNLTVPELPAISAKPAKMHRNRLAAASEQPLREKHVSRAKRY